MGKRLALRRCSRLRELRPHLAEGIKLKSKMFNFIQSLSIAEVQQHINQFSGAKLH